ncbi:MAG: hypothetical protein RMK45_01035 [Armatimonadota bacterium]|nr:hypothetical protein [Armatimonadota bacterium]
MRYSPEELETLERTIEALRQFPHLRRAMIEALQMEELFTVPARLDELRQVVIDLAARLKRVEQLAEEAKQEAREAKQAALEARQEAQEARQVALEAKQAALEAKQEAQEAKQIALEVRDRMDKLEVRMQKLEERMDKLETRQARTETDLGELKGVSLELRARRRVPAILGRFFKRMRIYDEEQLYQLLGDTLPLDEADATELLQADLFVHAQLKASGRECWLVIEVSWGVGLSDVERASERAGILQRHGYEAIGVVMGHAITPEAEQRARELGVLCAIDGALQGAERLV